MNGQYFTMQNIYLFLFIIHCFCETGFTCVSTCASFVDTFVVFALFLKVSDSKMEYM